MAFFQSVWDAVTKSDLFLGVWKRFTVTGYKMTEPVIQDSMTIERMIFTNNSTIGEFRVDGEFVCYTLEDTCRDHKIPGKTAIPPGNYMVIISRSDRFHTYTPELLSVPNFEGVRIHKGNTDKDTKGCILVGMHKSLDLIYDCREAYAKVFDEVEKRLAKGPLFISIVGGRQPWV